MIILETRETNIGAAYFLMVFGAVALIAIAAYVVISILLHYRKRRKQKTQD